MRGISCADETVLLGGTFLISKLVIFMGELVAPAVWIHFNDMCNLISI